MKKPHERFGLRHIPVGAAIYGCVLAALGCLSHAGIAMAEKEPAKPITVETASSFKAENKGKKADKPDQNTFPPPNTASSEAYDVQPGNSWWEHAEGDSVLRRFIKLFYGPDRPPGPDPDVDTNISAGGAGGG